MATDAENLTGVWQGLYTYPSGRSVSFVATLIDSGGSLSGSTHEPCSYQSRTVFALLEGTREGHTISFLKTYQNTGPTYTEVVRYRGALNSDATEIEGRWTIQRELSGQFLMVRPAGRTAEVEHTRSELV